MRQRKKAPPFAVQQKTRTLIPVRRAIGQAEVSGLYEQIRAILSEARHRAARSVNIEMVRAYWLVGQAIVEQEQRGKDRADYGEHLIEALAERLTEEFGKGFQSRNLWWMREFYLKFPILNAVRSEWMERE